MPSAHLPHVWVAMWLRTGAEPNVNQSTCNKNRDTVLYPVRCPRSVRELVVNVRKVCKIWKVGDDDLLREHGQKRSFDKHLQPFDSCSELTGVLNFGTEGCRFESCRVCLFSFAESCYPTNSLAGRNR